MSNIEKLLDALAKGEIKNYAPQSRVEQCLLNCIKRVGSKDLPDPNSRMEALLHRVADVIAEDDYGGSGGGGDDGTTDEGTVNIQSAEGVEF